MKRIVAVVILALCGSGLTAAEPRSAVGRKGPEFNLNDFRGKASTLDDFKDAKLVVLAFLGTECPLVKLYGPRLASLAEEYRSRGVAFVGINANAQDSVTEIAAYARRSNITFPILKDLGNKVADALGAERTPEVFVLDGDRVVRYQGRIDDQYGIGYQRDEPRRHDLKNALDELLAGKTVSTSRTEAVGCIIGRIKNPKGDASVTYSKHIAPILQARCVECHREGEIAPFSLADYKEVAGWASMIEEVVDEGRMPPWHANPKHGKFSNERRLSEEEKRLIREWNRAGAPEGDPRDLPKPREFVSGWQLPREPDQVIYMADRPFNVQAEGEVRYKYFAIDPGFTEDKWIQAAEIVPGNRAVVHHILVLIRPPQGRGTQALQGFFAAYVPGHRSQPFPDGMAKRIPAGSKLIFQVHYTPIGTPQQDRSKLGLVFADPTRIKHEVVTMAAYNRWLIIPRGADNHRVEAKSPSMRQDAQLLGFMPHMHLRGKSFRYDVVHPDGKTETILDVPNYDFNWQTVYQLQQPITLPRGARLHCTAHFNNSEDNLNNPDPGKIVRWGDQTWEEMMIGYFNVAIPRE